jgi:FAD-dependent urate hydroxylase
MMTVEQLNRQVRSDLEKLNYGARSWVKQKSKDEGHVFDSVIIGGGQSGLGSAFGLKMARIDNIQVIDDSPPGFEGPWETYARMMTLRTPKHLTTIDGGIPSLTFRSFWEAQHGTEGWEKLDKIPRGEWMNYLRWYRTILDLPVRNGCRLISIVPNEDGVHRLELECLDDGSRSKLLARTVVLATGIQGGGQWHTPPMIRQALPKHRYAHTSEPIDFRPLRGKAIAILGGGASAFDNANHALTEGVGQVSVFIRRHELPRINPIRQMEYSGMIEQYCHLTDAEKYAVMAHFFSFNQPPTNDTYSRAAAWPGFRLHTGAPWTQVEETNGRARVTTPKGQFEFDFLILSTGMISDPKLRPELSAIVDDIALWSDHYEPPETLRNPLLDAHPYLDPYFGLTPRDQDNAWRLKGIFVFNYSALLSLGLSASALSGVRFAIPKLVSGIGRQLFCDDRQSLLRDYFNYDEEEFVADRQATTAHQAFQESSSPSAGIQL